MLAPGLVLPGSTQSAIFSLKLFDLVFELINEQSKSAVLHIDSCFGQLGILVESSEILLHFDDSARQVFFGLVSVFKRDLGLSQRVLQVHVLHLC